MRLQDVFNLIVEIEQEHVTGRYVWRTFDLWPLMRRTLWVELNNSFSSKECLIASNKVFDNKITRNLSRLIKDVYYSLDLGNKLNLARPGNEQRAFISRPVYLQGLPSGKYFDRIVDPLFFLSRDQCETKKYYVASGVDYQSLSFPASGLRPSSIAISENIPKDHIEYLLSLAVVAGLKPGQLLAAYCSAFDGFVRWYKTASVFLSNRKKLKEIFLTSWYFPDMMGICAAAAEQGVNVIEVQHGKQGRYQAMYSGWTKIPEKGYELMPDHFWCWGQPSCNHILLSSPDRKVHRPFIGGFPWLDYYKKYISTAALNNGKRPAVNDVLRVLMTTQPSQGMIRESIPDFVFNYLETVEARSVHFIFRSHPNDRGGVEYCKQRLAGIPGHLYSIDNGKANLYDRLLESDLHITAYSSCCYEADALGVPTLLFGEDARTIYSEEIESGMFAWTEGDLQELIKWMATATAQSNKELRTGDPYIVSSLEHSSRVLASL